MASPDPAARYTVVLHTNVPLDRLLVERMQALTDSARRQWLRSLLIEGFLLECRMVQVAQGRADETAPIRGERHRPVLTSAPFTLAVQPCSTGNLTPSASALEAPDAKVPPSVGTEKPLAYLRRVIG